VANLLEQLSAQYDIVLIDTPPLLPMSDAAILAKITGGALVVAAADKLHRQQFANGLGSLQDVGARVLDVVLNRLSHKQSGAFSYYDYASEGTRAGNNGKQTRTARTNPRQRRGSRASKRDSLSNPSKARETDRQPVRQLSRRGQLVGTAGLNSRAIARSGRSGLAVVGTTNRSALRAGPFHVIDQDTGFLSLRG